MVSSSLDGFTSPDRAKIWSVTFSFAVPEVVFRHILGRRVGLVGPGPVTTDATLGGRKQHAVLADEAPQDVGEDVLVAGVRLTVARLKPQVATIERRAAGRSRGS